jgi:type VI secretion system protein ImpF
MSRIDPHQELLPSVLDRLIDPEAGGTKARKGYTVEQMFRAVQRDLEDLLNTRTSHVGLPAAFAEVHHSLIAYGLPDLTSLNAVTPSEREAIGRVIEGVIARFEPRLREVRATLIDPGNNRERTVRFHIDAKLSLDPAPEVAFDTILELTTGHYVVQPSGA